MNITRLFTVVALIACVAFIAPVANAADTTDAADADKPCPHCSKCEKKDDAADKAQQQADIDALLPLREYIGRWRGLGAKKRGAVANTWEEDSEWEYDFPNGRASLIFECSTGKFYREGEITPSKDGKTFTFELKPTSPMAPVKFTGKLEKLGRRGGEQLVLIADKRVEGHPTRITIRIIARGDRMMVKYDKPYGQEDYLQIGEVGFTRKGSGFGGTGSPANECVVTGGWGNGSVNYKGKSYYICCTGCRDMFNEDPERCLADYAKRKAKQAEEKRKRDNE